MERKTCGYQFQMVQLIVRKTQKGGGCKRGKATPERTKDWEGFLHDSKEPAQPRVENLFRLGFFIPGNQLSKTIEPGVRHTTHLRALKSGALSCFSSPRGRM